MLDKGNIIINGEKPKNTVITNHINLGDEIDAFIVFSSTDTNLLDLLSNIVYDVLISKIKGVDTYTELSEALESINTHIRSFTEKEYDVSNLNGLIGIQEKNLLYFSKLGKASAFLIKQNSEVIEITDVKEKPAGFVYISSGNLKSGEIILFSTTRILNHLTNTEILESASLDSIDEQNENIKEIIEEEKINKDIGIISLKYDFFIEDSKEDFIFKAKNIGATCIEKVGDTLFVKRIIAIFGKLFDRINIPKNVFKNIILFGGVFISFGLLYIIVSSVFTTTDKIVVENHKQNLEEAKSYVEHSAENINNPDIFEMDLKKAEELVYMIKDKKLFLGDIEKILSDITALRKQFNQIDTYDFREDNLIVASTIDMVKIISLSDKIYYIEKNKIIGPIISGVEPKTNTFKFSEEGDYFIDATVFNKKIVLLTNNSKVINFTTGGNFSYISVKGQDSWEKTRRIGTYASNIYLLDTDAPQIYKHRALTDNFDLGQKYLKDGDVKTLGEALTMAIDGGFYILKKDLSLVKFFNSPKYRLESLLLNKLPRNYNYDDNSEVFMYTRNNLNYIYLFMNNKIWIFKPDTRNYASTKSLTYIGQIEGGNEKITGFYIKNDGYLLVSNKNGIYKLEFQLSDGNLIIK